MMVMFSFPVTAIRTRHSKTITLFNVVPDATLFKMNKKQSPKVLKYCLISFIVNITALAETIPRLVV